MAISIEELNVKITAEATSAINSINRLEASLQQLQTTLNTLKAPNLSTMASKLANIASSSGSGLGLFSKHARTATKSSASLASTIGRLYATFWMLRGAFNAVGGMIDVASDLTEVENVVDNTFYGMRGVLDDFVQDSAQKFGMAELSAKNYASRFQAMGMAMGITSDQVQNATNFLNGVPTSMEGVAAGYDATSDSLADMSLNLTKLTADMASFYNTEQSQVAAALQSGILAGQSRALRQYGLDLTNATVSEWALAHGMQADMSAMTQAQKTMLRYQYVMANTANIQGDFERTAGSWHNQIVQLKAAYQQLAATIGTGLINAFKPFLSGLNSVLQAVTSFAEQVLNALGKIFGWEVEISASGIADTLGGAADAAGDLADNAGGTGGGLKDAGKEADKLKRKLLSFDELHVLDFGEEKDPSSGGGGGGGGGGAGGGGGGGAADGTVTATIKSTKKLFESEIDSLYELGEYISSTLRDAMASIDWDSIYSKASNFGVGLAEFLNGLLKPDLFYQIGRTLAGCLNTALHFLDSFGLVFDWSQFGDSIAEGINGFFENFDFKLLKRTMKDYANGVKRTLKSALTGIKWDNIFDGAKDVGEGIADSINAIMDPELFGEVGKTIANCLKTALVLAVTVGENVDWEQVGKSIAEAINEFFETFDPNDAADAVNLFLEGIKTAILNAVKDIDWEEVVKKICELLKEVEWGNVAIAYLAVQAANLAGAIVGELIKNIMTPKLLVELGTAIGKLIVGAIKGALAGNAVKTAAGGIGGAITGGAAAKGGAAAAGAAGGAAAAGAAGATGGALVAKTTSAALPTFIPDKTGPILAWLGELKVKAQEARNGAANLDLALNGVGETVDESKISYDNLSKALIEMRDSGKMSTLEMYNSQASLKAAKADGVSAKEAYDGLTDSFNILGSASIPEFNKQINSASESNKKLSGFGETATTALSKVKGAFSDVCDKVKGFTSDLSTAKDDTSANMDGIQMSMVGGWGPVMSKIEETFGTVKSDISSKLGDAKGDTTTKIQGIKGEFTGGWGSAKSNVQTTFENFRKNMVDKIESAKGSVSDKVGTIKDKFLNGWQSAKTTLSGTFETFKKTMTDKMESAKSSIDTTVKKIKGFFTGLKLEIPKVSAPDLSGVEQSISGFIARVKSYFSGLSLSIPRPTIQLPWFGRSESSENINGKVQTFVKSIFVGGWNTYATGGFPEEGPFYMNRGEIAGRFSNGKSVVANNQQIIEGIKQGVMEALISADSRSGGDGPVIEFTFKAGEDTLYRAVRRGEQKYNRRFSATATV